MSESLNGATVLITGGTGTFGSAFAKRCLKSGAKEVRILSRDERKQYEMANDLQKTEEDHRKVRFYIGDIRDRRSVESAMDGVEYVFHAAAMKQVPTCESFPLEAVRTNILGSSNVLDVAVRTGVRKMVCLSTDKAVYPISSMGLTKSIMEKVALEKAAEQDVTQICITRFGNLLASSGSVVPVFMDQAARGVPLTVTNPNMTRFLMSVADAMDLVEAAFKEGVNGDLYAMKSDACRIGDLAQAVKIVMRLPADYPIKIIGGRPGERAHEALLTDEEACRATESGKWIITAKRLDGWGMTRCCYRSNAVRTMSLSEIVGLIECAYKRKGVKNGKSEQ